MMNDLKVCPDCKHIMTKGKYFGFTCEFCRLKEEEKNRFKISERILRKNLEKKKERPDWDTFFIELAQVYSQRSTCTRLKVGCVIVKNKVPVSFGYNGSISGHEHCSDAGCLTNDEGRCIRTIHAEQNALLHADRDKLKGATAYVTHEPCETCAKLLVQAGIDEVIFAAAYPNKYNSHFTAGIVWHHHKGN